MSDTGKLSVGLSQRRILYVIYTNPAAYPPLEHSSRIFANSGWEVLLLGIGAMGAANQFRFPFHEKIGVRQLRFCSRGWRQKLHYFLFGLWTCYWTLRWRPKWIYASDMFSCPVALALSFLPGVSVVYHEHDFYYYKDDRPAQGRQPLAVSRFIRFVLWCRQQLVKRVSFCILPNEKRIEYFKAQTGTLRPVFCVWNCPRKEEVQFRNLETSPGGKLRLAFHGSINKDRLPLAVLDAISRFKDQVRLTVVGYETVDSNSYISEFLQRAERMGLSEAVEFVGALPTRGDLFQQASKCDVGLAFMPLQGRAVNMVNMAGASNKPFDYLACGLAVLVSDLPEWKKMYVEPGYGLACNPDDPASISQALLWFMEHPEETRQMRNRGGERILQEWNYETQFAQVLSKIELISAAG